MTSLEELEDTGVCGFVLLEEVVELLLGFCELDEDDELVELDELGSSSTGLLSEVELSSEEELELSDGTLLFSSLELLELSELLSSELELC